MGRKSCRKQQKQLSPQPAVATPLPPRPPGFPPSREIWDWLVHPEGKMEGWRDGCRDLEDLLGGLEDQGWCMACGVQGHTVAICPFQGEKEEEQQPGCYCCAEPGHSSTNCPWYPLGQLPQRCPICGGEHLVAHCPVHQQREEQGLPQSPPPAGGGRLLLPPPQPQVQQRPEEPENLFPWCTWCGEVDHRWRDCSEVPPSWCGRCEEGGHDWSGCPYASSPVPKREEPERPQPKEEEVGASIALGPKLPAEGECLLVPPPSTPEWGEPERPQPKREESVRPQPKREESVRPQPKEEEIGASIVLGPKPPAEEECLLSPCPPAEGKCLLSPCPPAEGKCLLIPPPPAEDECLLVTLPPPAEGECLLGPRPPAEDECLLVTLPQPAEDECLLVTLPQPAEDECLLVTLPQPAEDECLLVTLPQPAEDECLLVSLPPPALTPAREGDKPQSPARKAEPHQSPAREAEQDQSPAKGGDYTLLPPSSPGDHMLLPPPLLPPQEPEGEELQAPPPENFWGGEGQDAGVPQQPLFMLLKAARRAPAQPPQRREPVPPGAEELELPLSPPPPGAEELELPLPPPLPGAEELELPLPPVPPPQGVRWPEPQKGELPVTKKGEEVWRPPTPAAVSLPEFMGEVRRPSPNAALSLVEGLWPEPHQWELLATKKGEVGGPPAPAAFSLQDGTSMLSAVPLPAGVLTAWPAMGPVKPPLPARDFVLDCWVFKGGGGH
ncbi:UNVERIFIED_CONTAM: hypothetical protein FKN15_035338 [Acipenser sinensis]